MIEAMTVAFLSGIFTMVCFITHSLDKMVDKKDKYEFYLLSNYSDEIDKKLKEYQEEGWEIAGNINSHYFDSVSIMDSLVFIPLKRKIKTK